MTLLQVCNDHLFYHNGDVLCLCLHITIVQTQADTTFHVLEFEQHRNLSLHTTSGQHLCTDGHAPALNVNDLRFTITQLHQFLHSQFKIPCLTLYTLTLDVLSLMILGIQIAAKEDISSTAAVMVYRLTLRLSGEFFTPSPSSSLPELIDYVM